MITSRGDSGAFVDDTPYNHYSLLATVEKVWRLGYLQNAADRRNVPTMDGLIGG
jgi:hypothetical protein